MRVLREHELALSAVYDTFARLLPDMAEFWRIIAAEERAHADVVSMLSDRVPSGSVFIDRKKFTVAGIRSNMEFLSGRLVRFRDEGVTEMMALNTAIDAERGALEKEFFTVFLSKDPEIDADFEELMVHTKEHLKRLEDERERRRTT